MAQDTSNTGQAPKPISPYTVAMSKCLVKLDGETDRPPDLAVVHTLINLVQGRMLEYLADRICRVYGIVDAASRARIVHVLLRIFSDEFFALFRSKVESKPNLVMSIARRIYRKELQAKGRTAALRDYTSDRLFPAIFRKYFEYRNLDILLEMVESDEEIQKIVLLTLLRKASVDETLQRRIMDILEEDADGVVASLFLDYISKQDVDTLLSVINSGAWEAETRVMKERMAHLRGD